MKCRNIILLCVLLATLCSCDALRRLAGRPTSADIEAKREMIRAEQASHLGRVDSTSGLNRRMEDSLSVADSLLELQKSVVEMRQLSKESRLALDKRYYVIVGAFSKSGNAGNFAAQARSKGYDAHLVKYLNGFTAVGINPTNELSEAYGTLREVRSSGFCPDAWILDNRP